MNQTYELPIYNIPLTFGELIERWEHMNRKLSQSNAIPPDDFDEAEYDILAGILNYTLSQ